MNFKTIEEKERELTAAAEKFKASSKDGLATFNLVYAAWAAMRPQGLILGEVQDVLKKVLG